MRLFLLCLSVVMLPACFGPPLTTSTACTDEARAGLNITVKHATTGAEICDATVVASEGSYSETLMASGGSPCTYAGAYERKGTYSIRVTKTGFHEAVENDVVVNADECHVSGVQRTITLTPE